MIFAKNITISRIFAFVLSIILVVSGLCFMPETSVSAAEAIYYVSPDGNDTTGNGSKSAPYATLKKTFAVMKSGSVQGATVVIMGDLEPNNKQFWREANLAGANHTGLFTLTGKDPVSGTVYENATLRYDSTGIKGPTKVEYLELIPCRSSCFINTCGYEFIFGEGLTHSGFDVVMHDGIGETANKISVDSTNTTVKGGTVAIIYVGGGYPEKTTEGVGGDCRLTVNGGSVGSVKIGFDRYATYHTSGKIDGNVFITVDGGTVSSISGNNLNDNKVGGFISVVLNNGAMASCTLPNADDGTYLICAGPHGAVESTDTAGLYKYNVDRGFDCYVDGILVEGGSFEVDPGEHEVAFMRTVRLDAAQLDRAYAAGFPDGTFCPDEMLTRAQAIELVLNATTEKSDIKGEYTSTYPDISKSDWYYDTAAYFEYINALPAEWEGELCPNDEITRAEFVYIVDGLIGKPSGSSKLFRFSDVSPDDPYYTSIMNASYTGHINGYGDGNFCPERSLSRAEAVTIINRYLSRVPIDDLVAFDDTYGHWACADIMAAATSKDQGGWDYIEESAGTEFVMPEGGKSSEDYIKALYSQSENLSGMAIRNAVDVISEQMKKDILYTPNTLEIYGDRITGTVYYISEKNGKNLVGYGKSPEKPLRSYTALLNYYTVRSGDAVLYERGGVYRQGSTVSSISGVVYGAYGEGDKPLIMQSKKNYADPNLWVETPWDNVWKCTESLFNVGVIGYDHDLFDYSPTSYDELYGNIYNMNTLGFKGPADMNVDLSFYSVLSSDVALYNSYNPGATGKIAANELYVYSTQGNPGERFSSIEIGEKYNIFSTGSNVTFDNLAMKFTGAHAIGFGNCKNLTVTNCVFSWLGGSVLRAATASASAVNYGNAVEIYGSCNGYYVTNNWMYQIYDTGVTHQYSDGGVNIAQEDVHYTSNLIEYCHWSIEFYNAQKSGEDDSNDSVDYTRDIYDYYNVCRMGGYGWGSITRFRTKSAQMYCGASLSLNYDQYTEYNIFDRCAGSIINLPYNSTETDNKNFYIQTIGCRMGNLKGTTLNCNYDSYDHIVKYMGDENAIVVVIDK